MTDIPRRRVLIVDDEPEVASVLDECVRGEHATEIATDGAAALAAVRRARPDLILLDMNMPEMSGLDVLRGLQEIDARIPVIMITATADHVSVAKALEAGAFSYIPKPFNLTYVRHLVTAALGAPPRTRPKR